MKLSDAELEVLVVLSRHLVRADGVLSHEEVEALHDLETAVGLARWRGARDRTREGYESLPDAIAFAATLDRAEARDIVWEALNALAQSDELHPDEEALLGAVAASWQKPAPAKRRRSLLNRGGPVGLG